MGKDCALRNAVLASETSGSSVAHNKAIPVGKSCALNNAVRAGGTIVGATSNSLFARTGSMECRAVSGPGKC